MRIEGMNKESELKCIVFPASTQRIQENFLERNYIFLNLMEEY